MSVEPGSLEHMFDGSLPGPAALSEASDAALAEAAAGWAAASAAAEARKLAVIAEVQRRAVAGGRRSRWAIDEVDAAAAGLSCALTISHGRALGQIELAVTLRDRLPKVGARFLGGHLSAAMVSTIVFRTALVRDEVALAHIDSELADNAAGWGPLSQHKLEQAVDFWVDRHDPDAVRRLRNSVRVRDFTVGDRDDATGTASVHGRLTATDAVLLERRITDMIASVCDDDPRTLGQRRSDAVGAIAAHATRLACRCDDPGCAGKVDDGRASSVTIHVIADQESLDAALDPKLHGEGIDSAPTVPAPALAAAPPEPSTPAAPPEPRRRRKAALIAGATGAIVPAPLLAELIAGGAKIRYLGSPCDSEDRYRPSTALSEFVRTRDLTCRWPGCDRPAAHADIDHTEPWPAGPTHPGNIKCYCRLHHLVKTFCGGFTDAQFPDGTVQVTTPTGHTYTTKPFSTLLFPAWNTTTPPAPDTSERPSEPRPGRDLMMPTRRRTREQSRAARIATERRLNAIQRDLDIAAAAARQAERAAKRAQKQTQPPPPPSYEFPPAGYEPDYGDDPPPF